MSNQHTYVSRSVPADAITQSFSAEFGGREKKWQI